MVCFHTPSDERAMSVTFDSPMNPPEETISRLSSRTVVISGPAMTVKFHRPNDVKYSSSEMTIGLSDGMITESGPTYAGAHTSKVTSPIVETGPCETMKKSNEKRRPHRRCDLARANNSCGRMHFTDTTNQDSDGYDDSLAQALRQVMPLEPSLRTLRRTMKVRMAEILSSSLLS